MILRKLCPWERNAVASHLLRLAPEDRMMRFCSPVTDAFIRTYCDGVDPAHSLASGCFVEGALRGVCELVLRPGKLPLTAEAGLSVERAFQNRGIGGRLFAFSLVLARNRLIREIQAVYLPENAQVRRLLSRRSETACRTSGEAKLALPWPGPDSVFDEMTTETRALLGSPAN